MFNCHRLAAVLCLAIFATLAATPARAAVGDPVTLIENGQPRMTIVAGEDTAPAEDLQAMLARISGADLPLKQGGSDAAPAQAIYVGRIADFPSLTLDGAADLGPEGFIIRSDGANLYLIAQGELGVQHAVTTFLHKLGCRWFFPGEAWEVIPEKQTIHGGWNDRQKPTFSALRRIWYGFGAYRPSKSDYAEWMARNRMGGPEPIGIGHTWYGINREKDFEQHPEWFALVDSSWLPFVAGKRKNSKPCYSHPEVIAQIVAHTRAAAEAGASSVSLSPPDGLGYCQCELCQQVFQGGKPFDAHRTTFAERPDGVLVNITSETLFNAVKIAAESVQDDFPDFMIGCYAYSAYSHPPSFELPANVYVQTTTSYRRTPLSLEEQIETWGNRAKNVGIRGYWSVYQWDWDNPDPGVMRPTNVAQELGFFAKHNVVAFNAECSNNWAPRGLGYYAGANLLWDVNARVDELVADFYHKAFGPAAEPMQRWYVRWYGQGVKVLPDTQTPDLETTVWDRKDLSASRATLAAALADLDAAADATDPGSPDRQRVDQIRLYGYYLYLRLKQWEASAAGDHQANLAAIRAETRFGGRLVHTNMIHTRPLIGKAFHRRFKADTAIWENDPGLAEWGEGDRSLGESPSSEELATLWQQAMADLAGK